MIDVLLATYNGEPYLAEQLDSVFNQDRVKLRILVRDDGSSDKTVSILQRYEKEKSGKLIIIDDNGHLGAKASFANLLNHSEAPYMAFCDQDDVWLDHKLSLLLEKIQELEVVYGKGTPLLVHSDLRVVNESLQPIAGSFWNYSGLDPERTDLNCMLVKNPVTGCALLANRALVEKAIPVPNEAVMHDHWLALVASAFGRIEAIREPLVMYRQHKQNVVGAQSFLDSDLFKKVLRGYPGFTALKRQASAFHARFAESLEPNQASLILGFSRLSEYGWFGRRKYLVKHGILMPGFLRNIALLLCVRLAD